MNSLIVNSYRLKSTWLNLFNTSDIELQRNKNNWIKIKSKWWQLFIPHLKDSEHGNWERVEVWGRCAKVKVEGASEQLHAEQGEDEDEEEEEEEEGDDGLHGGEQGDH